MTLYQEEILNDLISRYDLGIIENANMRQIENMVGHKLSYSTHDIIQQSVDDLLIDMYAPQSMQLLYESKLDQLSVRRKIINAIKNRYYLAIYYVDDDGNKGFRLVEPYVIGKGYKSKGVVSEKSVNNYYMRCYIIRSAKTDKSVRFDRKPSYSFSKDIPYWRLFRVDRIQSIVIIKKKIRWYRELYTGGTDSNIASRIEWSNINDFNGVNPYK